MSDARFDDLTRRLAGGMGGRSTRRRFMARIGAAVGLGGAALLAGSLGAAAAGGIRPACSRLGQAAGRGCCFGLVEDVDGVCRVPLGGACREGSDCAAPATACVSGGGRLGAFCEA